MNVPNVAAAAAALEVHSTFPPFFYTNKRLRVVVGNTIHVLPFPVLVFGPSTLGRKSRSTKTNLIRAAGASTRPEFQTFSSWFSPKDSPRGRILWRTSSRASVNLACGRDCTRTNTRPRTRVKLRQVVEARFSSARLVHLFLVARSRKYWWGESLAEGDRSGRREERRGKERRGAACATRERCMRGAVQHGIELQCARE